MVLLVDQTKGGSRLTVQSMQLLESVQSCRHGQRCTVTKHKFLVAPTSLLLMLLQLSSRLHPLPGGRGERVPVSQRVFHELRA